MGQPQNWAQLIITWFPILLLVGVWVLLFRSRERPDDAKEVKDGKDAMRGIGLVAWCIVLCVLFISALFVPWAWTNNQVAAVAMCIVVGVIVVWIGRTWWSGGRPAVRAGLARIGQSQSSPRGSKTNFRFALLCAAFGMILAFVIYLFQQHGIG